MKCNGDPNFEPMKPRRHRSPETAHLVETRKRRLKRLHKLSQKRVPK